MQKLKQSFINFGSDFRSPDFWIGFTIGAVIFAMGFMALTMFNQSHGYTSLEAISGDATFYHPAVILAALEWPCGFPITGLLVAISGGFLRIRSHWAKPVGLFLLFIMLIAYLAIAIFIAIGANIQGPSHLVD